MEIVGIVLLNLICIILVGAIMFSPIFIYILIQQKTRIENLEGDRGAEQKKRKEWMIVALNYKSAIEKIQQKMKTFNVSVETDNSVSIQELQAIELEFLNIDELKQLMDHYTEVEDYTFATICRDRIKFLEETK